MSLEVGTGKAKTVDKRLDALARGRADHQYFAQTFLGRTLHDGQLEFVNNAEAKVNVLATANRWGKTTVMSEIYMHAGIYKTGAEWRYVTEEGQLELDVFTKLKYEMVHTAYEWEQAAFVWEDALKLISENTFLSPFVTAQPKSKPPHIKFLGGAKWMFRTLGVNASNIDGKSIYVLGVDEAGWASDLETMMRNVLRIRVADVYGRIILAGTFKPGIARDFFKVATRASAYTGKGISFDHRTQDDDGIEQTQSLDSAIKKYLKDFGIDLDEYRDALNGY